MYDFSYDLAYEVRARTLEDLREVECAFHKHFAKWRMQRARANSSEWFDFGTIDEHAHMHAHAHPLVAIREFARTLQTVVRELSRDEIAQMNVLSREQHDDASQQQQILSDLVSCCTQSDHASECTTVRSDHAITIAPEHMRDDTTSITHDKALTEIQKPIIAKLCAFLNNAREIAGYLVAACMRTCMHAYASTRAKYRNI